MTILLFILYLAKRYITLNSHFAWFSIKDDQLYLNKKEALENIRYDHQQNSYKLFDFEQQIMSPVEEEVHRLKVELIEKEAEKNLEIIKLKHEIEILNKDREREREIEILNKDREVERLNMKHEIEILNKDREREREIEILNKDREVERLKHEIEKQNLKREIALANWESLKTCKQLHMRMFLDKFKDKNLRNFTGERNDKFRKFAEQNIESLRRWLFDSPELFIESFSKFYQTLNQAAHPSFDLSERLVIPEYAFTTTEFRILGLLWEAYELPIERFQIYLPEGALKGIATYKCSETG
ncbi:hypothetical protein ABEB36_011210 [Hypothenemus hampei]|uniref:Uncharacterized protein n=1 Tax=Hypothenemus hampei TaxID=57062 RepID=A0ABD1EEK5_HYPHA